ncbi:MAG TPA: hypothetical protein PKM41_03480 [Deltaproteobacteria bacterium]|nr:hypothetical protein [Deltaproteobacteria bacterium]HOI06485.1 hypothetical protein [Deltaproteobacteria bacterium]
MDTRKIEEMIRINPMQGFLPCPVAHYIAASLGVSPRDVGDAATSIRVKLDLCQLGLFGYGRKNVSDYKILGRPVVVPEGTLEKIRAAAVDGHIACKDLWEIAGAMGITRPEAGNAADSLGLKVSPCQLGAF